MGGHREPPGGGLSFPLPLELGVVLERAFFESDLAQILLPQSLSASVFLLLNGGVGCTK